MPEVASSRASKSAESLWARSLRLTIYIHVLILAPLWLAAPFILKTLFGEAFLPATGAFRWLLLAAAVWGSGSIVISGLRGFGYPGLSTTARFSSALVTAIALPILLPRLGITGAAIASLFGYSVMLSVALFGFIKKRQLSLWNCLRPRRQDVLFAHWRSLRAFAFAEPVDGSGKQL